jgi:hypothetical protein
MNAPKKYVVSRTLTKPLWRETTIIRDNVIESVRALKAQPGGSIVTDGSSQLVHALLAHDLVGELYLHVYPVTLGSGKRVLRDGVHTTFRLASASHTRAVWWNCITSGSTEELLRRTVLDDEGVERLMEPAGDGGGESRAAGSAVQVGGEDAAGEPAVSSGAVRGGAQLGRRP